MTTTIPKLQPSLCGMDDQSLLNWDEDDDGV
eukprot:CAMPEP_0172442188 /NCGR_PEP_ID=MMETSP1065-20121228/2663_1 /TAXON_ID=265537 /ORGANISM="Amphiprora paludosa, Strain CCMP125" /LENGTH=30 /DNA_ID= /DNA_START= /DNA_END= /DNA_ORIENTATION=